VADFNNDAVPDIAITTQTGIDVFLGVGYLGGGTYSLSSPTEFTYALANNSAAQGIVVGDFNADGYPDLAVALFNNDTGAVGVGMSVYSGNGTGYFVPTSLIPVTIPGVQPTTNPIYPVTADLNQDGHPDFIVPNFLGNGTRPGVFLLYSSTITQIAPALGTTLYVTPSPGTNFSGSRGPETLSTVNCQSNYGTYLGTLTNRTSIAIQPQFDGTPVWVGGPKVTTCPGCPFSRTDAGFSDAGPGIVGEEIATGGYLSKNLGNQGGGLWCIKAAGAQDGTYDGGWTVISEFP